MTASPPNTPVGGGRARALVRGAAWNQLGQVLPVLAAVALVPPLVHRLGVDRFGVLSLAWMLIGYFTLFDLGVSGALTKLVAERLASGREDEVAPLVWTALALTTAMGTLGAIVVGASASWLATSALRIPPPLQPETIRLTWVLAASLPIVTNTAALAGVLAAQQRFGVLNLIRVPMGVLTYLAPLLALHFGNSLVPLGIALALVRFAGGIAHAAATFGGSALLRRAARPRRDLVGPIVRFGGWMTVTAIVSPIMVYLDRFLIGSRLSMSMVTYYTTPYDLTQRIAILALPVVGVMFPAFAGSFATDRPRAGRLFAWSVRANATLLFPLVLVCSVFPRELMTLWLGADFATHSATVLRLLALGIFLNGMAQIALAFLQSSGRPDLGARVHVLELLPYLALLAWLIGRLGILGAAIAWIARVTADFLALFLMSRHRLGDDGAGATTAIRLAGAVLIALVGCGLLPGLVPRIVGASAIAAVFTLLVWRHVVMPGRQMFGIGRAAAVPPVGHPD